MAYWLGRPPRSRKVVGSNLGDSVLNVGDLSNSKFPNGKYKSVSGNYKSVCGKYKFVA